MFKIFLWVIIFLGAVYALQASNESTPAQTASILLQVLLKQAQTPVFAHIVLLDLSGLPSQFLSFSMLLFGVTVLKFQNMTDVLEV